MSPAMQRERVQNKKAREFYATRSHNAAKMGLFHLERVAHNTIVPQHSRMVSASEARNKLATQDPCLETSLKLWKESYDTSKRCNSALDDVEDDLIHELSGTHRALDLLRNMPNLSIQPLF